MRRGQNSFFEKRFSFLAALHMRWNIPYPTAQRKAKHPIIAIAFDIMKLLFSLSYNLFSFLGISFLENVKSQAVKDLAFSFY
ncbi:hypothetical protein BACIH_3409 [Bacillus amyloliquefaciens]|nr:hypothetical protein U471_34280 [Bacillus amyloliquefaciens CC178]QEY90171.1 hypothetical protein BACIT_2278 [Bacillus amyloliquefaciens]QEY95096.1 hypothetical protein BACIH_3409 [Bacillus amyloliquefaciens]RUR98395.1 hypothetical protein EFW57_02769 [Bacillus velezensis]